MAKKGSAAPSVRMRRMLSSIHKRETGRAPCRKSFDLLPS